MSDDAVEALGVTGQLGHVVDRQHWAWHGLPGEAGEDGAGRAGGIDSDYLLIDSKILY